MTNITIEQEKLFAEQLFTATRDAEVANGNTISLHIENPSDSGTSIIVDTLVVTADKAATGTYYRNPDTANGATSTHANDFIGSAESTVATITEDADLTNPSRETTFPMSDNGAGQASLSERPPIGLQEGSSFGIEVASESNSCQILILVVFYETERGDE